MPKNSVFTPDDLLQLAASDHAHTANARLLRALIPDPVISGLIGNLKIVEKAGCMLYAESPEGYAEHQLRCLRNMPVLGRLVYRAVEPRSDDPVDICYDGMDAFYLGGMHENRDRVFAMHIGFEADVEVGWFSGFDVLGLLNGVDSGYGVCSRVGLAFDVSFRPTIPSDNWDLSGSIGAREAEFKSRFEGLYED